MLARSLKQHAKYPIVTVSMLVVAGGARRMGNKVFINNYAALRHSDV